MQGQTGLERRGSTYWFRMRVPADLPQALRRNELRHSLETKDRAEAKRLVIEEAGKHHQQWRALREPRDTGPSRTLTSDQAQYIADYAHAHRLKGDEADRIAGIAFDADAAFAAGVTAGFRDDVPSRDRAAIANGQYAESLLMAAEDWLSHFGFQIDPASVEYRRFVYLLAQGSRKASEVEEKRAQGDVDEAGILISAHRASDRQTGKF